MQIVINIDDTKYHRLIEDYELMPQTLNLYEWMIVYGDVLPEHHGDLIDRKELYNKWVFGKVEKEEILNAPTVLEGVKE